MDMQVNEWIKKLIHLFLYPNLSAQKMIIT